MYFKKEEDSKLHLIKQTLNTTRSHVVTNNFYGCFLTKRQTYHWNSNTEVWNGDLPVKKEKAYLKICYT
jgi:hypothetical protein